jgi:hypothetical protein
MHLQQALRRNADELCLERGLKLFVRTVLNSGEVVVGKSSRYLPTVGSVGFPKTGDSSLPYNPNGGLVFGEHCD